jgi:glucose/arabinose dehydrogenase
MRTVMCVLLLSAACDRLPPAVHDPGFIEQDIYGEKLYVRPGFRITNFAYVNGGIRNIAVGPDGYVYAATVTAGTIVKVRDTNGDGVADTSITVLTGLVRPFGMAFRGDTFFFAEERGVSRMLPGATTPEMIVPGLPTNGGHSSRTIAFGPDGKLYVSVGSSCNVCLETDSLRASILQFNPDGSGGRVFASGLRNSVGLAFNPTTGDLWATNNDRDDIGGTDTVLTNDFPPERINIILAGKHYGWPQCFLPGRANPEFPTADCRTGIEPPAITFQAHSAPLGIMFYTATAIPAEYQGDAFVAYHGSWNRTVPTGDKVVRVQVQGGRPVAIDDFITGWQHPDGTRWGRPVAIVQLPDGSMLISDDYGARIWRVWYQG